MHRAVLLAQDEEISAAAILMPDGSPVRSGGGTAEQAAMTAEAVSRSMVGRTVADVEKQLILDTLEHCLGNRTHAAKILGISIRTLRKQAQSLCRRGHRDTVSRRTACRRLLTAPGAFRSCAHERVP